MGKKQDEFGDRMKQYEKNSETNLDTTNPIVIRIDGKRFSRYTQGLEKPYCDTLHKIMCNTTEQIAEKLHADVAYYQSDEVTLVFLPKPELNKVVVPFDGRVQKLVSVVASMFTSHFIAHLHDYNTLNALFGDEPLNVENTPYFDARVYNVNGVGEATNAVLWRIKDCQKNFISCVYRYKFCHKKMQNKSGKEMIQDMLDSGFDAYEFHGADYHSGVMIMKRFTTHHLKDEYHTAFIRSSYERVNAHEFASETFEKRLEMFEKCANRTPS